MGKDEHCADFHMERNSLTSKKDSVPVRVRLVNVAGQAQGLYVHTVRVHREAVVIALYEGEQTLCLIPPLLSQQVPVELEIEVSSTGERIRGTGRAVCYDTRPRQTSPPHLMVAISLDQMAIEDRIKWESFVGNTDRVVEKEHSGA